MLDLVREPLERFSAEKNDMDEWEYILYTMALAFTFEGLSVIIPSFHSILVLTIMSRHHPGPSFLPVQLTTNFYPSQFYKLLRFVTWSAFSFWNIVSGITDCLFIAAFVLRMVDLRQYDPETSNYRLASFQVLSCASPLIWYVFLFISTIFE